MIGSFDDGMQFAEPIEAPKVPVYRVVATRYYDAAQCEYITLGDITDLSYARQKMAEAALIPVPERDRKYVKATTLYGGLYIEVKEVDGSIHPLVEEVAQEPEQVEAPRTIADEIRELIAEAKAQTASEESQPAERSLADEVAEIIAEAKAAQAAVVTKFYGKSGEVDVVESVRETIKASNAPVTVQAIFDVLSTADASVSLDSIRRAFKIFSNPMVPSKSMYLCDEVESGVYRRREIGAINA